MEGLKKYPLPWEVHTGRDDLATVYAADSTPVAFLNGKGAKERAELIVELANRNGDLIDP